jgi:TfoX/Sxy family transcriptional regulator of competence genes
MSYNRSIEENIDTIIRSWENIEKKKMFGGICYLLDGNICFGIWRDFLIVRAGAETAESKLKERHVKPFDITGKPMKGWLMVTEEGMLASERLEEWLLIGRDFALTLPRK